MFGIKNKRDSNLKDFGVKNEEANDGASERRACKPSALFLKKRQDSVIEDRL